MTDSAPQFEVTDELGFTLNYSEGVGNLSTPFPSSVSGDLSMFLIKCPRQIPLTKYLEFSIDNSTWNSLYIGEAIGFPLRSGVKQIFVKGNVNTVDMQLFLLMENP